MVTEAAHYGEARRRLVNDPIVRSMADGVRVVKRNVIQHENGTPRFEFMQAANDTYARRGGTYRAHLGAVAEAILMILNEDDNDNDAKEGTMNTTTMTETKPSRYNPEYAAAYRARHAALREDAEFETYNIYEDDADELEYDEPEFDDDDDTTI